MNKPFTLMYFAKRDNSSLSKGISANDFEKVEELEHINLGFISSISQIHNFFMPLSGSFVDKYAIVSMNNGDRFYVKENIYNILLDVL
jgi:hypothetical protein